MQLAIFMGQTERLNITKTGWTFIAISWFMLQLAFLWFLGIEEKDEAAKYIELSERLVAGSGDFQLYNIWYAGYIGLHSLFRLVGLPVQTMYVFQLILSFVSMICFIRILATWTSNRMVLTLSGLLYATCFIIQQWVPFLFTDTVFYMLLIIASYYLLNENKDLQHRIIFWLFFLLLPFFRPVGVLFVLVACLHWLFTWQRSHLVKILLGIIYLAVLFFVIRKSLDHAGYFYPYHNLDANIICGLSSDLLQYQVVPYNNDTKVPAYLMSNPEMSIRLFLARFYKSFSFTRPYFSLSHNLAITLSSLFYYSLAVVGLLSVIRQKKRNYFFLLAGALIFCIPGIAFCVEWSGRMALPTFCFTLVLSAIGVDTMLKAIINDRKKTLR